jgi:uncharacterized protein (TIGR00369 family)
MPADPEADRIADEPADGSELEARIAQGVVMYVPHNRAIGMRFVECRGGRVTVALPYDEKLVGNPLTRVLHGGAITALMDATCGAAVFVKLKEPTPVATLDLRIDYLKPAAPDREVHAVAECFKVTRNVAFVRCETFHPGPTPEQVAVANGTFIIFRGQTIGRRKRKKEAPPP